MIDQDHLCILFRLFQLQRVKKCASSAGGHAKCAMDCSLSESIHDPEAYLRQAGAKTSGKPQSWGSTLAWQDHDFASDTVRYKPRITCVAVTVLYITLTIMCDLIAALHLIITSYVLKHLATIVHSLLRCFIFPCSLGGRCGQAPVERHRDCS